MDKETLSHIFEPFFTTKDPGKGTGLGLSMAYGIVKQHDGHIHAYSELDNGTTFKIYLPASGESVETETEAILSPSIGGSETILIAEDEESLRNLLKDILEGLGYTVLIAKDGLEAVEIFAENRERIDMLLFDVVMPRMNGVEAYERIHALNADIPLILLTGYSSETIQSRFVKRERSAEEIGATVIQKPYSVDVVGRKVREVLAESRELLTHI
jgi:two-component system cell cycle sensor histidine kinase/response regulator CckA